VRFAGTDVRSGARHRGHDAIGSHGSAVEHSNMYADTGAWTNGSSIGASAMTCTGVSADPAYLASALASVCPP